MHMGRGGVPRSKPAPLEIYTVSTVVRSLPVGGWAKRAFDLFFAACLSIVLAPALCVIAALVRLTSKGPVLFWTDRIGLDGVVFSMPKFRTMSVEAPLQARESLENVQAFLTPVGGFLRRSSLDELPQVFCVLTGGMSLVGPRPLLPTDRAAKLRLQRPNALRARPGITGLAQLRGRNFLSGERKVRYDEAYARLWSFGLDIRLLFDTILYVMRRRDVM